MRRWLFLVVLAAGCVPTRVSSECQAQISECLKHCSNDSPPATTNSGIGPETRSPCEAGCEGICH